MQFDGLMEKLGGFPFVQCHRSYIVNLLHVREPEAKDFVMKNGSRVPISRKYQAEALKVCREFFWKRIQGDIV
jgi:DNA-binding LytR/AlgR family response regulator